MGLRSRTFSHVRPTEISVSRVVWSLTQSSLSLSLSFTRQQNQTRPRIPRRTERSNQHRFHDLLPWNSSHLIFPHSHRENAIRTRRSGKKASQIKNKIMIFCFVLFFFLIKGLFYSLSLSLSTIAL